MIELLMWPFRFLIASTPNDAAPPDDHVWGLTGETKGRLSEVECIHCGSRGERLVDALADYRYVIAIREKAKREAPCSRGVTL